MTQILSLQAGDGLGTEDRSPKRADEGADASAFEGLLALAPNSQDNSRAEDHIPSQATETLGQFQGLNQRRWKSSKDQTVDELVTSPINGGIGGPQHYPNVGKTGPLGYSATSGDAHESGAHSSASAMVNPKVAAKTSWRLPSEKIIDNSLRQNDLSPFAVKVTDQQTHFAPVGGPNPIDRPWAAISAEQSVNTNAGSNTNSTAGAGAGRRAAVTIGRDSLDAGRLRHDFQRLTADGRQASLAEASSPPGVVRSSDASDAAPFRATGHSAAELAKDLIASATPSEPVIRELTPAQSGNEGTAPMPSAASQVLSAVLETAPTVDPSASRFASQFVPNHHGPSHLKSMTVELKPEAMGLVQVQMTSTDGVLVIRLEVENSETLASLDGASAELAARINSGGLQLSELVVSPLKADRPSEPIANGGSSLASGGSSGNGSESRQGQAGRSAVPRDGEVGSQSPRVEMGPKENTASGNIGIFSPGRRSWRV